MIGGLGRKGREGRESREVGDGVAAIGEGARDACDRPASAEVASPGVFEYLSACPIPRQHEKVIDAMKSTSVRVLVSLLAAGCKPDNAKQEAKVDTEETLQGAELELRKAYAADAMVSMTAIASSAQDIDLCASTGDRGSIGPTPPMTVDCNAAEDGQCAPVHNPKQPWEYNAALWNGDVWTAIRYVRDIPHRYHHALEWKLLENGKCEHRARIFGDLDGDGIFSTYEMVGEYPGPPRMGGREDARRHASGVATPSNMPKAPSQNREASRTDVATSRQPDEP